MKKYIFPITHIESLVLVGSLMDLKPTSLGGGSGVVKNIEQGNPDDFNPM